MPHFAYRSRNAGGQLVEGVQEGASAAAVAELLAVRGLVPVAIQETRQPAAARPAGGIALFQPKVGHIDLLLFSRQTPPRTRSHHGQPPVMLRSASA